jgi:hypothetical protein
VYGVVLTEASDGDWAVDRAATEATRRTS